MDEVAAVSPAGELPEAADDVPEGPPGSSERRSAAQVASDIFSVTSSTPSRAVTICPADTRARPETVPSTSSSPSRTSTLSVRVSGSVSTMKLVPSRPTFIPEATTLRNLKEYLAVLLTFRHTLFNPESAAWST